LKAMNLYGAIIGKALYDKKIDFKEAQQLCLLGE
ncbi:1-(5-phosphoribosyl)-5-((5-phosphoribosylamino)methylideneamino)imidazole-4-carboxamide isomerase, partial [Clostridioides difficile]|nr:1-(5-phosphoribosyl)-5-((5-phosphoribosylamino)methylideneamino)imidazole-4-carboxamide isomerase [Clostridioides difficile]